ncbi:precorrin-4 C(11)-methyltransferase [Methanocella sp. CWC-04]|uniref:Precorrin-4 C(11)-methyltransferase n=1 Tax=Methanooceanicella nereidis TaxID=2052831 RepID=A0AAP2REN6_9EURY|nr:precorrin-4 C(11)-methyltransferase [Methanocella sp. CWC-04]MCD1295401.1 precorrin-4 C(11)-methyltransferase [Methanocella sp. CWC-04]
MEKIYFVGAGPGDPGLITVKGMELLKSADVLIYAGSLVNPELVNMSPAPLKMDSWGMSLEELVSAMESNARAGKLVIRLHSGDPSLYGAIVEQIAELKRKDIEVEVVPGVSSMFAAASALQTQLTLRGVSESVIITRPAGATLKEDNIREFSRCGKTMVIFLGTEKMEDVMSKLECPKETPVAVVYHASWPDQKIVKGTVADICRKSKEAGIERTALIIIGGIVDPSGSYERSLLYS